MLKAVYNFNPKNTVHGLNAQGDCPPFPYPLWHNILCNCHIDFGAIIEDFQSIQAQYDDSIQLGEGEELTVHHGATGSDRSAPKVTGSLPLVGTVMPSSGPTHTTELSSPQTHLC